MKARELNLSERLFRKSKLPARRLSSCVKARGRANARKIKGNEADLAARLYNYRSRIRATNHPYERLSQDAREPSWRRVLSARMGGDAYADYDLRDVRYASFATLEESAHHCRNGVRDADDFDALACRRIAPRFAINSNVRVSA